MTRGDAVVASARSWIGTPYRHQATLKGVGCDCLGLLRGVWREVVGPEPELPPAYSADWAELTSDGRIPPEPLIDAAARWLLLIGANAMQPGDVLIFRWRAHLPAKHLAIMSADDRMIHAHDGASVCETHLSPWWRRHLAATFRFPKELG